MRRVGSDASLERLWFDRFFAVKWPCATTEVDFCGCGPVGRQVTAEPAGQFAHRRLILQCFQRVLGLEFWMMLLTL